MKLRTALPVAGLLLIAAVRVAGANCGAEGCPLAPQGPEAAEGRFVVDFGYQYIEANRHWNGNHEISAAEALAVEGGTGHILEQVTLTRSFLINARARVTDRLLMTASMPYIDRIHEHTLAHHPGFFIPSMWHMKGPGDATLLANWSVLSAPGRGVDALTLQGGVKLPTGQRNVEEVDGEQPEPSARPGTGSTDAIVGAQYVHLFVTRTLGGRETTVPLSANVSARINSRGTADYKIGNEWDANLSSSYGLSHKLQLLGQLNFSSHARDEVGNTDAEPHSTGSTALFASPGLRMEILPGMAMFGYYQFRLYEHTNGPQLVAPYHVSLGLGYSLP